MYWHHSTPDPGMGSLLLKVKHILSHKSKTPCLPCDLCKPQTCTFHPLTSMGVMPRPEGSGLLISIYQLNCYDTD